MAQEHEQLIARIAEQVIATLRSNGVNVDGGAAANQPTRRHGPTASVPIRPPAGVCTGDYSKFPELKGRFNTPAPVSRTLQGSAPHNGGLPNTNGDNAHDGGGPILRGFVTQRQLEAAGPVVTLARGAKLTPLARDYIKEKQLAVCTTADGSPVSRDAKRSAEPTVAAANAPYLYYADGPCENVNQLAGDLRDRLKPTAIRQSLATAVRDIARSVKQIQSPGGVLFVHSAARAACFANRCPSLRAVVGTCGEAVEQGIDLLGANVLIVEYPHVGPRAMREMVERFLTAPRPNLPDVDTQLQELSTCD